MRSFKEGDIVEIVSAQEDVKEMINMIGTVQTIDHLYCSTSNHFYYVLKDSTFIWREDYLELYDNHKLDKINENDVLNLLKE